MFRAVRQGWSTVRCGCFLRIVALVGFTMCEWAFCADATAADTSEADFFRGRTITLDIPSTPGAAYDLYARLVTRYLSRYLPGNPPVIAQYVPAAAGIVLANSLYNSAPKDGTTIGIVRASTLYEELFGNGAAKFDGPSFNWIGNLNSTQDTCVFVGGSQVRSPTDLYASEHVIGASAVGAIAYSLPTVYNEILGTKMKIVLGYEGVPDRLLAIERGEIEGGCGMVIAGVKANLGPLLKAGKLRLVAQAGITKNTDFPDLPNMLDEAKTPEARLALEFLLAQLEINIAVAAPPGLPEARITSLRTAFEAMLTDKELLDEVQTTGLDFHPLNGRKTLDVVRRLFATPKPLVERIRTIVTAAPKQR